MKEPRNYRVSPGGTQSNCSNCCSGLALRGRITSVFNVTLRRQTIFSLCHGEGTGELGPGKQNPSLHPPGCWSLGRGRGRREDGLEGARQEAALQPPDSKQGPLGSQNRSGWTGPPEISWSSPTSNPINQPPITSTEGACRTPRGLGSSTDVKLRWHNQKDSAAGKPSAGLVPSAPQGPGDRGFSEEGAGAYKTVVMQDFSSTWISLTIPSLILDFYGLP